MDTTLLAPSVAFMAIVSLLTSLCLSPFNPVGRATFLLVVLLGFHVVEKLILPSGLLIHTWLFLMLGHYAMIQFLGHSTLRDPVLVM